MIDAERVAKLETQVEAIKDDVAELKGDMKEIHSRITTQTREIVEKIDSMERRLETKMTVGAAAATQQHNDIKDEIQLDLKRMAANMDNDIQKVTDRVDTLERWRWMIVGGAVVLGYILGHMELFAKFIK